MLEHPIPRLYVDVDTSFMAQDRPNTRARKIAALEAQVLELQAKLAESEKLRAMFLEDGLRLSQEKEALKKERAALKKARK